MKGSKILIIGIIFLSFLVAFYLYPLMPNVMVSHWGIYGEANGYSTKFVALFLMPIISTIMYLLFLVLPRIDPLKENIEKFRSYFDGFIVIIISFLFYLYVLTLVWNLGYKFNLVQFLTPAFGILFYFTSVLLEKAKRNWFIGIRTPWTLSSDEVWNKTHKLGAKLFKIAGAISFLGIILPNIAIFLVIVPVISFSFYLLLYSYLEFRRT